MLLLNLLRAQSLKSFSFTKLNDKPDKAKHFRFSRAFTVRSRAVSRYWRRILPDEKNRLGDVAFKPPVRTLRSQLFKKFSAC